MDAATRSYIIALRNRRILCPVSSESAASRLAVCRTCEYYRPSVDRCGLCGCSSTMTQRSSSRVATCPIGKWPLVIASTV